jgi:hypothetical protein
MLETCVFKVMKNKSPTRSIISAESYNRRASFCPGREARLVE